MLSTCCFAEAHNLPFAELHRAYICCGKHRMSVEQVVGCSCAVVTDYGDDSEGKAVLQDYLDKK